MVGARIPSSCTKTCNNLRTCLNRTEKHCLTLATGTYTPYWQSSRLISTQLVRASRLKKIVYCNAKNTEVKVERGNTCLVKAMRGT